MFEDRESQHGAVVTSSFADVARAGMPSMQDEQFRRWVELLERKTGIVVPNARREFLVSNLRSRMREAGFNDFDRYYEELQSGVRGAVEWAMLVDRLTVHQTHFFRHQPSFSYLHSHWIPDLVATAGWDGSVHAWSVGCATGEEAYSLAMTLDLALSRCAPDGYFGISATDVSQPALGVGRGACYAQSKIKEIPEEYRSTYTKTKDSEQFEIVDGLKKRVAFLMLNILDIGKAAMKPVDLIFCQNVLIYFARERRSTILDQFVRLLRPGGLLVLGSGEVMGYQHPALERVQQRNVLAYRRQQ